MEKYTYYFERETEEVKILSIKDTKFNELNSFSKYIEYISKKYAKIAHS